MESLDLNLLVALDALLEHNSVTVAAQQLNTSAPAMSRTLARIRRVLGDPVLVRAGRDLVPTPRALELRGEVRAVVERARAVFAPSPDADLATVTRSFALQTGDVFQTTLAAKLLDEVRRHAPGLTLRFRPESLENTPALREGQVDLEVGVIDAPDPETRVEPLVTDQVVGIVRAGHPLTRGRVTAKRLAAAEHVVVSRRGRMRGPLDDRLAELGLHRRVVAVVPSYTTSLFLARDAGVTGLMPARYGLGALDVLGLRTFEIPVPLPPVTIGMAWHPRNDADLAHRWLRERIRQLVR